MKIAMTIWGKWISPVFDSAQTLLVVEIESNRIVSSQQVPFNAEQPLVLLEQLNKLEVSHLICGAISEFPARILENESLKLVPFISGNADAVIRELTKGNPIVPMFLMPGCRRRGMMRAAQKTAPAADERRCCQRNGRVKNRS
ncbi:dinitrogenase iron-molybdenum cofactor biosynthesis domain-containing protein [bacterium]|nr:dinitrogenase iron-molybdenum cofactor biosynthesis domain-containing protein [bacterium]